MIFVFLLVTIALLFLYVVFNKGTIDFCEPVFLYFSSTVLSAMLVIANFENWNVEEIFSTKATVFLILVQVVFFSGYFLARTFYESLPKKKIFCQIRNQIIYISDTKIIVSALIIVASGAVYFFALLKNTGVTYTNYILFMEELRPILQNNEANIGIFPIQMLAFCKVIAYGFSYVFIWNLIAYNKLERKILIIPVLYLLVSLLTSGRNYFLEYVIYVYVAYFLMAKKKIHFTPGKTIKLIIKIVFVLIGVLVTFVLLANIVGRNTNHSLFTQVSVYLGGPLISFCEYFNQFKAGNNVYFGQESLIGWYQFLDLIGVTDAKLVRHLEFIQFGDNWGNVYTSFRRYINDFGVIGCCLVVICISFFYEAIYKVVSHKPFLLFGSFLFLMFMYPVPMMVVDDLLLSRVLSINTFLEIGYSIVVFYFLVRRGYRTNEKYTINWTCNSV